MRVGVALALTIVAVAGGVSGVTGNGATPRAFAIEGEIVIDAPAGSGCFGATVLALSTGNIVISDPCFDLPGKSDVGAVYLYDGESREQLTRLHGDTAADAVGAAAFPLANGNVVVASPLWGSADVGAVTWINGETGLDGPVTTSNSLTGTTPFDFVGSDQPGLQAIPRRPAITPLSNGNYVVASPNWDNGSIVNAGAITWGDGDAGATGAVSTANSLYGSLTFLFAGVDDSRIGAGGVTALTNGNYVVASPSFSYVEQTAMLPILRSSVGAATWANGSAPTVGAVTRSNSLHGTAAGDGVSSGGVTALANGHYVVGSPEWSGLVAGGGAATWGDGATGSTGAVATGNSLYGTTASEGVGGKFEVTALANGHYVATTDRWPNGAAVGAGAATFVNGGGPSPAAVSAANSLVGTQAGDGTGIHAIALTNGNYVIAAPLWDKPGAPNAGSVTWADGSAGRVGVIDAATSMTGVVAEDAIGALVGALTNGNYVVASQIYGADDRGSVTWANGSTGTVGTVGESNSIIGGAGDLIGVQILALSDGNYAFTSPSWAGGRGAVTWVDGAAPSTGSVTDANSIVGGAPGANVGGVVVGGDPGARALADGAYLVLSPRWDGPGQIDAGAVTIGRSGGSAGIVGPDNSVVGALASSGVGRPLPAEDLVNDQLLVPIPAEQRVVLVTTRRQLRPVTPARLLETRPGMEPGTTDDLFEGGGALGGGGTLRLPVGGRGGVPPFAVAAVLNVTVTDPVAPGYLTVFPCGQPRPTASNLNYAAGQTIPNAVIAQLGDGGEVCLYSPVTTHLVVDVNAYYPPVSGYVPANPSRIMETRPTEPLTVDGLHHGGGLLPAGTTTELQVAGRAGAPADAPIATLNVTVTQPDGPGYVTLYPCGSPRPNASNLNHGAGETIPNLVVTQIGASGKVCVYNLTPTHLVVDLNGWHEPASPQRAGNPARLLDTRSGQEPTVDGQFGGIGKLAAGSTLVLPIAGRGGIPVDATVASLNITVTQPDGPGYVTVYPCDRDRPNASSLNYTTGQTIPNAVITGLAPDGTVCLYTLTATHLIVDANGSV